MSKALWNMKNLASSNNLNSKPFPNNNPTTTTTTTSSGALTSPSFHPMTFRPWLLTHLFFPSPSHSVALLCSQSVPWAKSLVKCWMERLHHQVKRKGEEKQRVWYSLFVTTPYPLSLALGSTAAQRGDLADRLAELLAVSDRQPPSTHCQQQQKY